MYIYDKQHIHLGQTKCTLKTNMYIWDRLHAHLRQTACTFRTKNMYSKTNGMYILDKDHVHSG